MIDIKYVQESFTLFDSYFIINQYLKYRMQGEQIQALVSGALIMLILGSLYVYGGIAPYLESDLYYKGEKNITAAKLSIILTLSIITTNIGIFLSSLKKLRFNYRIMVFISITGVSGSTYALSYMTSLYSYIFFYGICFGLFLGYGYFIPIRNCYDYLPDKKGLGSGVCMMGFGLGPVIFTMALTYLINPNNLSPLSNDKYPEQVALNVPQSLRNVAISYFVIGLIGAILLKPKSQQRLEEQSKQQTLNENLIELKPIQEVKQSKNAVKASEDHMFGLPEHEQADLAIPEPPEEKAPVAVKRKYRDLKEEKELLGELNEQKLSKRLFYFLYKKELHMLVAILSMSSAFGLFIIFNYKSFGFTSIKNDNLISLIGSLGNLVSGCFRLAWGYWYDKYSFQRITTIINVCLICSCVIADFAVETQFTYFIIIIFVYAVFGGNYSIYPPQTVKMLGKALGSKVYFVTNAGFSIGAIIQYIATITLVEKYGRDGYTYCFIIFAGMLIMSIFYGLTIDFCTYEDGHKLRNEEGERLLQKSPEIKEGSIHLT